VQSRGTSARENGEPAKKRSRTTWNRLDANVSACTDAVHSQVSNDFASAGLCMLQNMTHLAKSFLLLMILSIPLCVYFLFIGLFLLEYYSFFSLMLFIHRYLSCIVKRLGPCLVRSAAACSNKSLLID